MNTSIQGALTTSSTPLRALEKPQRALKGKVRVPFGAKVLARMALDLLAMPFTTDSAGWQAVLACGGIFTAIGTVPLLLGSAPWLGVIAAGLTVWSLGSIGLRVAIFFGMELAEAVTDAYDRAASELKEAEEAKQLKA